jgi:cytoskeletal protein RodZ
VSEQPADQAQEPSVSTAPAHSRWRALPTHLGRARTSTLVLSVLFVAIGGLYLNVRPETVATTPAGGQSSVQQPAATTPVAPTTTETTEPTTEPTEPTSEEPTTTEPTTTETTGPRSPTETTTRSPTTTELTEPTLTTPTPTG